MSAAARMAIGIVLVFCAQYTWVKPTNFEGFDEWLLLSLASRGIVSVPPANRPLALIFNLPHAVLFPHSLRGVYLVHGAYLALSGVIASLIALRLLPGQHLLAFLAGVFTVAWVPSDWIRLATLYATPYSGLTLALWLAVLLLLESWRTGRLALLMPAVAVAFVAARCYEGVIPLLACALFLLPLSPGRGRLGLWIAIWGGALMVIMALALTPLAFSTPESMYQRSILQLDPHPGPFLLRLALQYRYHLAPVVVVQPAGLLVAAVPVSVLVFALAYVLVVRTPGVEAPQPRHTRSLLSAAAMGFVAAGLGYAPFVLSAKAIAARRTEFFAAAGIAVLLAALCCLAASRLSSPAARWLPGILAAWIVAVGSARTDLMQHFWDANSYFPRQHATLSQLTAQAPQLRRHTLVLLLDQTGGWPADFSFRHAVEYLYPERAVGHVHGAWPIYYPTAFTPEGLRVEPWPSIRRTWRAPVDLFRWEEIVVFHLTDDARLHLLMRWPEPVLPPLPAGALYDPLSRIDATSDMPPSRAILRSGGG
jgi:hypothetical protein